MSMLNSPTQQARVSSTLYHAGNRLPGTATADYNIRDGVGLHLYRIPVASEGVVDLSFAINHTLVDTNAAGVSLSVEFMAVFDLGDAGGNQGSIGSTLFKSEAGLTDVPSGGRFLYLPEIGSNTLQDPNLSMSFAIPEFRTGLDSIMMRTFARTTPTAGSFNFRIIRRY